MIFHCTASVSKTAYMGSTGHFEKIFMVEAENEDDAIDEIEKYYKQKNEREAYSNSYYVSDVDIAISLKVEYMIPKIPQIHPVVVLSGTVLSLFTVLGGFIATVELAKMVFLLLFAIIFAVFSVALVYVVGKIINDSKNSVHPGST